MTVQTSSPSAPASLPSAGAGNGKGLLWTGRILSVLPALLLLFSATMKLMHGPQIVEGFAKFGFKEGVIAGIGVTEILCTLLYAIPQTSVLGAILLTGYLGGAVVTHLRIGESFGPPVLVGVLLWAGLFLRDRRLRALLPLRRLPE